MVSFKSRKVISSLSKKGFRPSNSDHQLLIYYFGDIKTEIRTKVSFGANYDIGDSLISRMKEQLKLTKQEFCKLVECPLSKEELEKIYAKQGIINPSKLDV